MSTNILCVMPEPTMAQSLDPSLTQTEPVSAQAIPWSQMFNRPMAVVEARLKNAVVGVGRSRAVSGLLTQTNGMLSIAKSIATAFVPRTVQEQYLPRSASYSTCSDVFFVDLEAGIVGSYEEEEEEGQLNQDYTATPPHATIPFTTVNTNVDPKMDQNDVQDNRPDAHKSNLANSEGIVDHGVDLASCNTVDTPTAPSQLPQKNEPNKAIGDDFADVQYPLCHVDAKPITPGASAISVKSPSISSIPVSPQNKIAFKNYKSPTVEVFPEEPVQVPSRLHTETNASSRPDKKKQAKRSKKLSKAPNGPGVKVQGIEGNTKHSARNLPKFTAEFPKRSATISGLDEGHKGQENEQKAKKAKKAHESRFDLDEAMMDAPASLPEMAAKFSNPSPKRRSQSTEAQQVAEKAPKRAKRSHQKKGVDDDVMIDVDPADSHIPSMAPAAPRAATTSLKRGVVTPEAKEAAISSKTAKKPKQKHEGKLPIDVCVEFEDITQLVDARMREKEEKRQEERESRGAPKFIKRSRGSAAAEAADEADKSTKKPKMAKDAEEAKQPELRKAVKRGRASGEEAEKPMKKLKSKKGYIDASFERHPRLNSCGA